MSIRSMIRISHAVALALGVAILGLVSAGPASAQGEPAGKRTTVTFSAPFEVPGGPGVIVLPAGSYVFKLLKTVNDRSVVLIYNSDETKLWSTILAVPNYRLKPTDELVMTFAERSAGSPQALRAWFCPGDKWGQEFVYPKAQALVLAEQTEEPVLYVADVPKPPVTPPTPAVVMAEPVKAITAVGVDIPISQVVEPPPVLVPPPAPVLPKTASDLPLLALMGILLLGAGLTSRALRCVH